MNTPNYGKFIPAFLFAVPSWFMFHKIVPGADHGAHIDAATVAATTGHWPPHFLYQILLNTLTGFSGDRTSLMTAAVFWLTLAVTGKLIISIVLITRLTSRHNTTLPIKTFFGFTVCLFFIAPIVNWWQFPSILKGQFTATLWHNPSTIMLMPLSLVVIFCLLARNKDNSFRLSLFGGLTLALSVLTKPNFAMVVLPLCAGLVLLRRMRLMECLLYVIPSCLILGWQFFENYTPYGQMLTEHHKSSIIINPFAVWHGWTRTPAGSLLVSFAFPAAFLYFFYDRIKNASAMALALSLTAIALLIFFLFSETGGKLLNGNFFWGTVPALYFLFLVCMAELAMMKPLPGEHLFSVKTALCWGLLTLHVLSGILFYARNWQGFSYYA